MPTFTKTIIINASPEKVFARFSDPMNMMEDVPNAVDVIDITGEGVGMSFKSVYKMAGMKFTINSKYIEYVENEKLVGKFDGGFTGTMTWTLKPENGSTKMVITIDYSVPVPLIGKIAESILAKRNEREWDVILANAKDAIEADS
jgi:uncharacterized protein YndB with AHSA1/START domain